MKEIRFAAFVMTYERPEVLLKTIDNLREQTFPPELILIIDNSISRKTEILLQKQSLNNLEYIRVGYNSGPAGASKIGLEKLTELGYDWIYWGDDDNPPRDNLVFEKMIQNIKELTGNGIKLGVFSGKGGYFNKFTGRIKSLTNFELKKAAFLEVDFVPGGHTLFVNSEIVKAGLLPDEKLFFGFEDLDLCFKIKNSPFKIYIDSQSWLKVRYKDNFVKDSYRWNNRSFGKKETLQREFYSKRNLLLIFFKNRYYFAFALLFIKSVGKMFLGYRYGRDYGNKMFHIQFNALRAFFLKEYGMNGKLY